MLITAIALFVTGNAIGDNFETRCEQAGYQSIAACRAQHEANKAEARDVLSEARERARASRSNHDPNRTRESRRIMREAREQAHALRVDLRKPQ